MKVHILMGGSSPISIDYGGGEAIECCLHICPTSEKGVFAQGLCPGLGRMQCKGSRFN